MRTHLGIGATIFVEDIICEGIKEVGVGILTCSLNNGTAIGELYRWHPRAMLRLLVVSTVVKANHHELPRGARDQSHHVLLAEMGQSNKAETGYYSTSVCVLSYHFLIG